MLEEVIIDLIKDYHSKVFIPILEADVVGYLFYLWITKYNDVPRVHLSTRICGVKDRFFDFVVGDVNCEYVKPCIQKPELLIEVTLFSRGFSEQQKRRRYFKVLQRDLPKLSVQQLRNISTYRYILLFDEDNYLEGFQKNPRVKRIKRIIMTRNELDPDIKIIYINAKDSKGGELGYSVF